MARLGDATMITTAAAVLAMLLTLILPIYPEGITPIIAAFLALACLAGAFGLLNRAARRELLIMAPWAIALVIALLIGSLRSGESRQAMEAMSVSRGMLLGWVCGTVVAAYTRKPSQVLMGVLVVSVLFVAYWSTFADFGSRYLRFEAASTVQGRFREIETAWRTFVEYPMFGAGLGAMFEVDGFYKAFVHDVGAYPLWKFGLIGTTLLAVPLLVVGRQLRRTTPVVRSYAVGGAVAVVAYLATCAAYKTYYLVWIYGVVAGASISWLRAWNLRQDALGSQNDSYDEFDERGDGTAGKCEVE